MGAAKIILTKTEETLFVGNTLIWSLGEGVQGGKKILLYKSSPPLESNKENAGSDGSLQGDLNSIYKGLKSFVGKVATELSSDYVAYSHLKMAKVFSRLDSFADYYGITQDQIENQLNIAEELEFGCCVKTSIHRENNGAIAWVELIEKTEQKPNPIETVPEQSSDLLKASIPAIKKAIGKFNSKISEEVLSNDEAMVQIYSAAYGALPFPIRMLVKQEVFVLFCKQHKDQLFS